MAFKDQGSMKEWQTDCVGVKHRITRLYESQLWTDCSFRFNVDGKATLVEAHSLVLAVASPVFAAMFYGSLGTRGEIPITDIQSSVFCKMLRYIYTENILIEDAQTAINVYYAANKYILPQLKQECANFLNKSVNTSNLCQLYEFSSFSDEEALKYKCLKIFRNDTSKVLKSCSFLDAEITTVAEIMAMDELNIDSELDLYKALVKYVKKREKDTTENKINNGQDKIKTYQNMHDEDNLDKSVELRTKLKECVKQIRFLTLTPTQFAECKDLSKLLTNEEIMAISLNIASMETSIEMPVGFSTSLVPRNEANKNTHSGFLRFTVNNITKLKKYTSETIFAQNIPFRVTVQYCNKRKGKGKGEEPYLRIYLECFYEDKSNSSLETFYEIKTVPYKFNGFYASARRTFKGNEWEVSHTHPYTISMKSQEKRDYGNLTFEVNIVPEQPQTYEMDTEGLLNLLSS